MNPSTFSIKGWVSLVFPQKKDNMDSSKIWNFISQAWRSYPQKVCVSMSLERDRKLSAPIDDGTEVGLLRDVTEGFISTTDIQPVVSTTMSLMLGKCYEYRIPFGTRSDDVGHSTILVALPIPMRGCYCVTADFEGAIRREKDKSRYMIAMNLEIYLDTIPMEKCNVLLATGYKAFPLKIEHPEYFRANDSSESEGHLETTDYEESDDGHELEPSRSKGNTRALPPAIKKKPTKMTRDKIRTGMIKALQAVAAEVSGPPSNISSKAALPSAPSLLLTEDQ